MSDNVTLNGLNLALTGGGAVALLVGIAVCLTYLGPLVGLN